MTTGNGTPRQTTTVWDCRHCHRTVTYTFGWSGMVNDLCFRSPDRKHGWVKRPER